MRRLRQLILSVLLVGCPALVGCTANRAALIRQLESSDPSKRILAIVELTGLEARRQGDAGGVDDGAVIPLLIDRLDDEDEGVRFYAILALERLSGTRRGYDYAGSRFERREAIRRWREPETVDRQTRREGAMAGEPEGRLPRAGAGEPSGSKAPAGGGTLGPGV